MDEFEQIVAEAEYVVAVLANPDTNDRQFVELERALPSDTARSFAGRGLGWKTGLLVVGRGTASSPQF